MKTRYRLRNITDKIARYTITIGGIGTILALLLVFLFLLNTTLPLFKSGKVSKPKSEAFSESMDFRHGVLDDYGVVGVVFDGKSFLSFSALSGEITGKKHITENVVNSFSYNLKDNSYLMADGNKITEVNVDMRKKILKSGTLSGTPSYKISEGAITELDGDTESVYTAEISSKNIVELSGKKIVVVDGIKSDSGELLAFLTDDRVLHVDSLTSSENILTGEITSDVEEHSIDISSKISGDFPGYLKLNSTGTTLMMFFEDSRFISFDLRNLDDIRLVEDKRLFDDKSITYLEVLNGRNTILVGDSRGFVSTWWPVEDSPGRYQFTKIHDFYSGSGAAIKFITSSKRDKSFLVLNNDNFFSMFYMTSEKKLFQEKVEGINGQIVAVNGKNSKIAIMGEKRFFTYDIEIPHPEATVKSVFGKVIYELGSKPEYVWQSSSGSDEFEPKFSLIPLIFGTIKATLIAMFFAVPVAIMGAVYTSEFLNKKFKSAIKSSVEIMASLPSVVLGFIAALIVSPFVENVVLGLIMCLILVPWTLLFLGNLFQLMPKGLLSALGRYRFLLVTVIGIPLGIYFGVSSSGFVEKFIFYGDFKFWLHNFEYSPLGGWFLILLPLGIFITIFIYRKFLYGVYENLLENKGYYAAGIAEIIKFLVITSACLVISWGISYVVTSIGFDLRQDVPVIGSIMGTYVQRNALIVGFIMGFAVIPIIYTVSEDALNAVPEHLRSASLAAGATEWQTVTRIIIPVAMSGIFSAVMIGFGRAIGETMIVLMAAGNTPILDMNIFSGFRTLSANIAVELPEAVIGSTHYRILYLAALVLFIMTFVINTVAEVVRLRYRKRSSHL